MRLAIINHSGNRIGGTEVYIESVVPELAARGLTIKCVFENRYPGASALNFSSSTEIGVASGLPSDLSHLVSWKPDILFIHGLLNTYWEERLVRGFRVVYFAHNYYGTCISGRKAVGLLHPTPCTRRFGPECLLHYYPLRCGGLSPFTMWRDFAAQSRRLANLRRCGAVITASSHMRREYLRNGLREANVHCVPLPVRPEALCENQREPKGPHRLLFVGRMVATKGGETLIDALPLAAQRLDSPLRLTFVGDGPERSRWEVKARAVELNHSGIAIEFLPWVTPQELSAIYAQSHVVVIPSLWPEPFGLVGLECAARGIPAAAFAVGGIPEWLLDGVNGHLAIGRSHAPSDLASAIASVLSDPNHYHSLSDNARRIAANFSLTRHVTSLLQVFDTIV